MRANVRVAHAHMQRTGAAPLIYRGPDRPGQGGMPGKNRHHAFVVQHIQRDTQPVKVMGRRGAVEIEAEHLGFDPRGPVPIARHPFQTRALCIGTGVEIDKAQPRRHHQPLLRGGDHHVDAPGIHAEFVTAQRGDAIHHQQRRMALFAQHPAQGGISLRTEVEVSVCTASTARIFCPASARRAARRRSGSMAWNSS